MSKLDRKNQSRQKQALKHQQQAQSAKVFAGPNGAPRIVAIVPLCEDLDVTDVVQKLSASVDSEAPTSFSGSCLVRIDRFMQSMRFVLCPKDLFRCLDICRAADYVMFVVSASEEVGTTREQLIRSIENQGVSTVLATVAGLDAINSSKQKQDVISSLKSYVSHFFPEQEKVYSLDYRQISLRINSQRHQMA